MARREDQAVDIGRRMVTEADLLPGIGGLDGRSGRGSWTLNPILETIPMNRESPSGSETVLLRSDRFQVVLGFNPLSGADGSGIEVGGKCVYLIWVPDKPTNAADGGQAIPARDLPRLLRDIRSACRLESFLSVIRMPDHTYVDIHGVQHRHLKRDAKKNHFPEALGTGADL
jgi:hypothetical protein